MANSLKLKIAIAGFGLFVLILIPLLQTNFFAPVTIKRWGKVSWDDFHGIPQAFSSYEAGISTSIFLEYDSAKGRYVAYAGQNNVQSWAKRSEQKQSYLLNHEQFHFNITELHARMLNDYIDENPDGSLQLFLLRLGSINIDLSRMQRQYDEETNHSLIYDKQRRWEYRIDSLLALQNGWLTDHFSGAQVYFTQPSDSSKGLADGLPYRHYAEFIYGMELSLVSYQVSALDYKSVATNIRRNIVKRGERLKRLSLDTVNTFRVFAISDDSSNYTYYELWVANNSYLYLLKTRYQNNTGDTTGYSQIASSFINSFRIVDTDSYWISRLDASDSPIIFSTASEWDQKKKKENDGRYCMHIGSPGQQGFYRGPFYRDDGAMYLACDYLIHTDSMHYKDVLLLNKDWYSYTPTSKGQIYFVPADNIPAEKFNMKFGYMLLQDSVKECYEFYHQRLEISPRRIDQTVNAKL
jgi:hypothetical protein